MTTPNRARRGGDFIGSGGRSALHRALLAGLAGVTLLGCSRAPGSTGAAPAVEEPSAQMFAYRDGGGSTSFVERVIDKEGRETLHGRTQIIQGTTAIEVIEDAILDGGGTLVRADVSVSSRCSKVADVHVVFERSSGMVRVEKSGGAESFHVPADAPSVYAPIADASGRAPATPVAAWVAFRAASTSPILRVIDVARHGSFRTPVDQLSVPTQLGTTIALGNNGIDVSDGFVHELRLLDLGVRLVPSAEASCSPLLACEAQGGSAGGVGLL